MMELFTKTVSGFYPLNIFAKSPFVDVRQGPKYAPFKKSRTSQDESVYN